jgi:hypothetical protein
VTDHQPLLQLSTPIRQNEEPQVVLRLDTDEDVQKAIALINRTSEVLVPLAAGLVDHLARALQAESQVVSQLQAAGLNPVPLPPTPEQQLAQGQYPAQFGPVPPQAPAQYQPQQQSTQAYAPPAQQAAPAGPPGVILMSGPCWASTRHSADCKDCGGPTFLKVVTIRGSSQVNAHQCATTADHKLVWCETPIWNSRKATAMGKGIQVPEGLVYG